MEFFGILKKPKRNGAREKEKKEEYISILKEI